MYLGSQQLENLNQSILLTAFLNQRKTLNSIKKNTNLNRSDLEIMAFAYQNGSFNAYQVKKFFLVMNVQQVKKSLKKLEDLKMIEMIGKGFSGRPKTFALSYDGEDAVIAYIQKLLTD